MTPTKEREPSSEFQEEANYYRPRKKVRLPVGSTAPNSNIPEESKCTVDSTAVKKTAVEVTTSITSTIEEINQNDNTDELTMVNLTGVKKTMVFTNSSPGESTEALTQTVESNNEDLKVDSTAVKNSTVESTVIDSTANNQPPTSSSEFHKNQECIEGYGKIPHGILEVLYDANIFGLREIRVVAFITRFTFGWNRRWLAASIDDLEKNLLLQRRNLEKTLKLLKNNGAILVAKKPNFRKNFYRLSPQFFRFNDHFFEWKSGAVHLDEKTITIISPPVESTAVNETQTMVNSTGVSPVNSTGQNHVLFNHGQVNITIDNVEEFSDINKVDKQSINKSLSLSKFITSTQLSELEARWLTFMKKEREREEKGLLKLFQQKPEEAELIFKAFHIVLKEQDEYGEIKSAIAVLETNYTSQYRAKALAAIARQQQKEKENQTSVETETERKEEQDTEAKLQMIRMQCFQEAFPDMIARKEYVLITCKANPMFTNFGFNSPIAVSYAVGHWATHEGTNQVLAALDQQTQN